MARKINVAGSKVLTCLGGKKHPISLFRKHAPEDMKDMWPVEIIRQFPNL